jgi:hypothetical protein
MRNHRILLTGLVGCVCISASSQAAEIGCSFHVDDVEKNKCQFAWIGGEIHRGDYEKLKRFFADNLPALEIISLSSSGGSVTEALLMGRLVRKYLVRTSTHVSMSNGRWDTLPQYRCASACALIWFGGVIREGSVGLHRPRIDDPDYRTLPPIRASEVYRKVLSDVSQYLDEMEVPRPLIDAMIATASTEIRWVDAPEEKLERPPSFAEWMDARCEGPNRVTVPAEDPFKERFMVRVMGREEPTAHESVNG